MSDLNWNDHFDNDREAGTEADPQEMVKDLIKELEHIYMLLEDREWDDAVDELTTQSGTIQSILAAIG
jgi:hypothetical protein